MSESTPETRGELEFVRRLRPILAVPGGTSGSTLADPLKGVPFGDDLATLVPGPEPLLWTVDMLMDGVDFDTRVHDGRAIGRKAMAVNLSDCAAMAVTPVAALCAVALPNTLSMEAALDVLRGAHEYGLRFDCPIVGGDTNSWNAPLVISVSVAARCTPGLRPIRRDGARPGDRIWLTGRVGGSILGRHMTFDPRIATALELSRCLAPHAMIDISDGVALDLSRILSASGCGAILDEFALDAAIHADAVRLAEQDHESPRAHALSDGEDFELIVVLPADAATDVCTRLGLLPVGRIVAESGLWLGAPTGGREPIPVRGWEHFR